jgi:hypothetical protein
VSLHEGWPIVRHFFDDEIPAEVVLDEGGAARQLFEVSTLPDTYLLSPSGRSTARFDGTRDWSDAEVRNELDQLLGEAGGR